MEGYVGTRTTRPRELPGIISLRDLQDVSFPG